MIYTYHFEGFGRTRGTTGARRPFSVNLRGVTMKLAQLKLHDTLERITLVVSRKVNPWRRNETQHY